MKKQSIFFFFLFCSTLTFAQSSLDSLRLSTPLQLNKIVSGIEISCTNSMSAIFNNDSKTCNILDLKTGVVLQKIFNEKGVIKRVFFSRDDRFLAIISNSGLSLWEIRTGNCLKHINIKELEGLSDVKGNYSVKENKIIFQVFNKMYAFTFEPEFVITELYNTQKDNSTGYSIDATGNYFVNVFNRNVFRGHYDMEDPKRSFLIDTRGKIYFELNFNPTRLISSINGNHIIISGNDSTFLINIKDSLVTEKWRGGFHSAVFENEKKIFLRFENSLVLYDLQKNNAIKVNKKLESILIQKIKTNQEVSVYTASFVSKFQEIKLENKLIFYAICFEKQMTILKVDLSKNSFSFDTIWKSDKNRTWVKNKLSVNGANMVTFYNDLSLGYYSFNSNREKQYKPISIGEVNCLTLFQDNSFVVIGIGGKALLWDPENLQIKKTFICHNDNITQIKQFNDNIITSSLDSIIKFWDIRSNRLKYNIIDISPINSFDISRDGEYVVTVGGHNSVIEWDLNELDSSIIFPTGCMEDRLNQVHYEQGDTLIIVSTNEGKVILYNRNNYNKKIIRFLENTRDPSSINGSIIIEDVIYMVGESGFQSKKINSDSTLLEINNNIVGVPPNFRIGAYSGYDNLVHDNRHNRVFFTYHDNLHSKYSFFVYNIENNSIVKEIFLNDQIVSIEIPKVENDLFFTLSKSGTLTYWKLSTFSKIGELVLFDSTEWLFRLSENSYYYGSKSAVKSLHYITPSLKVIGFEQLDPVYNRPDIVLDSIGKYFGGADQELVANYRQSWEKRIDRLGLDKEKLGKGEIAVPNAEIVDADDIAYENKEGKLNIKVSANDSKYPLRRFNVFVNEVPLYGSAGISIAHLKKQVWDTTVIVPLSVGENKIQVSVMNELGLENFKYPTYVNYTPEKDIVAKTHYIGIGVNAFKDSSHNLKYCKKDVEDLANSFSGPNTEVKLFTDQQVTKENILALKDYLKKTSVNDKVIISCSSHGLLDDSLNFYLAMHDVDFNKPQARGLKYEELESLLDSIPARQKLLLLDACNSGEIEKQLEEETKDDEYLIEKDTSGNKIGRGLIQPTKNKKQEEFQKMNELFVNVRNNTGSVIISAAGGQESALEAIQVDGKTIENGAFTYSILECLKQNEGKELKVNKLKQYAEKRVEEITNGKQKPTSRQETMEVDWGVR